jgi:hypothetical protein
LTVQVIELRFKRGGKIIPFPGILYPAGLFSC